MNNWINEVVSNYRDIDYITKLFEDGHRTGYVRLNQEQYETIKKQYEENLDTCIDCYGGVTFIEEVNDSLYLPDGYWVGFDTAHCDDAPDLEKVKEIFPNQNEEMRKIYFMMVNHGGVIKTKQFVEDECKYIIDQLLKEKE